MPKPPTFTDKEMLSKISDYFAQNGEMPTIAEVKRWGCGDSRAQNLLREIKGLPHLPHPQPEPQPQPQPEPKPKPDLRRFPAFSFRYNENFVDEMNVLMTFFLDFDFPNDPTWSSIIKYAVHCLFDEVTSYKAFKEKPEDLKP